MVALLVDHDPAQFDSEVAVVQIGSLDYEVCLKLSSPYRTMEHAGALTPPRFWYLASTRSPESVRGFSSLAAAVNAAAAILKRSDASLTRVTVPVRFDV